MNEVSTDAEVRAAARRVLRARRLRPEETAPAPAPEKPRGVHWGATALTLALAVALAAGAFALASGGVRQL
jgi:hypothetical protein